MDRRSAGHLRHGRAVGSFHAARGGAGAQSDDEIYVTAELTPAAGKSDTAYVGEQLVYTLRVVARVDASCPSLKLPDFPNATSYELGEQHQYRSHSGGEDVSVVEVFEGTLEVRASSGESFLGGEDFTRSLAARLLEQHGHSFERAELQAPLMVARMIQQCERAKCGLSRHDTFTVRIPDTKG